MSDDIDKATTDPRVPCPACGGPVLDHKPGCDRYCRDATCVAEWLPACDVCTDGYVTDDITSGFLVLPVSFDGDAFDMTSVLDHVREALESAVSVRGITVGAPSVPAPVVVTVEGGLVQSIASTTGVFPMPVVVIDYDADEATDDDDPMLRAVPQGDGRSTLAFVSVYRGDELFPSIAEFVDTQL